MGINEPTQEQTIFQSPCKSQRDPDLVEVNQKKGRDPFGKNTWNFKIGAVFELKSRSCHKPEELW